MSETGSNNSALTLKQQIFVREYLVDFNGTRAAKAAGYSESSAYVTASKMLKQPKIAAEIAKVSDAIIEKADEKLGLSVEWVLDNLKKVAERCMQAVPVLEKVDGEWVPTGEFKFDSAGANRSLELIGKHHKMFTDKLETKVDGELRFKKIEVELVNPKGQK